jgi:TetR/AcrR family transcriptional regulator, cholesterol catabolism regulator
MTKPAKRRIGRPPLSGPEAEQNPLNALNHEERRTLFMETAARLFEQKGYASTSVEDITNALGFTKGVFYYYWRTKLEILEEIGNRGLQTMHDRLCVGIADDSSPAARLEAAIANHIDNVTQRRPIIAVLLSDSIRSEAVMEGHKQYARRFQQIVEEGIAAGVVRDMDPQLLTFAILGLCNSIVRWYRPSGRLSAREIRELFMAFAAEGWRPEHAP